MRAEHLTEEEYSFEELGAAAGDQMPWVRSSLAFVNGWADTVAVQRFGFPSSKMSGNAARMTKAIGKQHWAEAALFCGMLLSCVGGAATFTWHRRRRGFSASEIAPVIIGAFVAVDLLPTDSQWAVLLLAMAWGTLNSLSKHVFDAPTCVLSGHLLTLGASLGALLAGEIDVGQRAHAQRSALIFLAFLCGVFLTSIGVLPTLASSSWLPLFSCLGASYAVVLLTLERSLRRSRCAGAARKAN